MASPKDRIYKPDTLSRRNEIIAWALLALAVVGAAVSSKYTYLPVWVYIGIGVLFVAAAGLSLGNWMDRRTTLQFSDEGVEFGNGLRHVKLGWKDVQSVQIRRSGMGDGVRVSGEKSRFTFTVSGGVRLKGKRQGKFGFSNGDEIIKEIVRRSGLSLVSRSGAGYYYARS
jgi:hypothetical protein